MKNKILVSLFLISVFFLCFLPVIDTDFGWHYRCGEAFLKSGSFSLCTKNNFSYFLPNYKFNYPDFLYDVGLAAIYDRFGFIGISFIGGIIMVLTAVFFLYLIDIQLWLKITAFYLSFFLSYPVFNLGLRSQVFSYLFFLITLFLLKKSEKNSKYLFFFPFLFLVWVNTHIGFFIGLLILFFYLLGMLIKSPKIDKRLLFFGIIFIFSLSITCLNFFGVETYREIVNHAFSPLNQMIAEWVAPPLWEVFLIIVLTIGSLIITTRQKNKSVFNILLILFFSILAFQARRNLPFFYTFFFYVLFNEKKFYDLFQNQLKIVSIKIDNIIASIIVTLSIFLFIIQLPSTISFDSSWNNYCNLGLSKYPCQAIKNYPKLSGNVYAMYEWGGFLIWQKPTIKVFIDGRMPAWKDENGQSPYQVFLDIIQTQPGWNEKLKELKTNHLLISNGTFLDLLLKEKAAQYGWQEKYRDTNTVIYQNLTKKY